MTVNLEDLIVENLKSKLLPEGEGETSDYAERESSELAPADRCYMTRTVSRFSTRRQSRLRSRRGSDSEADNDLVMGNDVAFRINIGVNDGQSPPHGDGEATLNIDVHHEAVQDAVQEAVQDAVNEVVKEAVHGAVHGAVQQVIDNQDWNFNMRANIYTLIAITGVVIFWRGVWTTWDYFFGFSLLSEFSAVGVGLAIMISFRLAGVPLLDGLPSG